MLSLRVQLLDFMDSTPYAQAGVQLDVRVMAGWLRRVFLPDVPPPGGGPRPRPPPQSVLVVHYDEARAVVLQAPDDVREQVDSWGPVGGLDLMRRVKDEFDPDHRFAPGRFVGGI